jgi:hypothetical protein
MGSVEPCLGFRGSEEQEAGGENYEELYDTHSLPHLGQLFEALCFKLKGSSFDAPWGHRDFSFTKSFRQHYGPVVGSACNRYDYHGYLLGGNGDQCLGLTTLPPSCSDCLEI